MTCQSSHRDVSTIFDLFEIKLKGETIQSKIKNTLKGHVPSSHMYVS